MAVKEFKGKIFYPVLYEGDAAAALESASVVNSKQKAVPVFREINMHCEEMRRGLGGMLGGDAAPGRIARVFEAARPEVFCFPKRGGNAAFYPRTGGKVNIRLTGTRFILFETHVAFFEMDFELSELSLEDAMNATYYLCEVKDEANHFEYEKRTFDAHTRQPGSEHISFSLKKWFLQCAAYLPGCENFEDHGIESTVNKPLLYGYYLLDEKPEDFERISCNIAQNYKASYKGLEGDDRHVLHAFDNSCWCASYNGAVNVSYEVEDPVTNSFFKTAFPHKWESEYLFLFLNTVHQKYAVLKYLAELSGLSSAHYDYALMKRLLLQGEIMQEKCEVLKTRCFFNLPSNVEHVNRVYSFFQRCFDIPGYRASLNAGVKGSVNVCKSYVTRIKEIENLEKSAKTTKNEMYIALITASITCLTFFNSSYTTLTSLFQGRFGEIGVSAIIVTATFLTTITTVVFNLSKQRETLEETRKKIKKLKSKTIEL
ncbi:hypothetical protein [Ruthenibacterium lactatiformans]|uniref:Uncharacterized protein n=1 Tax=Ruthenibacterium lactatiformans TaxID=1550024 RepID=A0A6I3QQU4_9FIRM|nr:hypothetical protein [Ruthenibacterium lactatiformans]MTS16209.1 hypothetical protein [Ruthenibacterium lactatiformans]MTS18930.1 hypothetical protein [Ruthenibacterium lactatiformans]MTS34746.1 hypothetical protein [Ruthenibacterium lactatiformans]MTS48817.1 hypothetical protein [Ruthenibacterium lactatiformans]MTS51453.1 hypothetical protein [Ruthenibacterium lactatiformans]